MIRLLAIVGAMALTYQTQAQPGPQFGGVSVRDKLVMEIEALEAEVEELRSQNAQLRHGEGDLTRVIHERDEAIEKAELLRTQLQAVQEELAARGRNAQQSQARESRALAHKAIYAQTAASGSAHAKDQLDQIERLNAELMRLRAELQRLRSHAGMPQAVSDDALSLELQITTSRLESARAEIGSLHDSHRRLQSENEQLRGSYTRLNGAFLVLLAELDIPHTELESMHAEDLRKLLTHPSAKTKNAVLNALNNENARLQAQVTEQLTVLRQQRSDLQGALRKVADMEAQALQAPAAAVAAYGQAPGAALDRALDVYPESDGIAARVTESCASLERGTAQDWRRATAILHPKAEIMSIDLVNGYLWIDDGRQRGVVYFKDIAAQLGCVDA